MRVNPTRAEVVERRRLQQGFTLMELLVSMTVVSLLSVSILFGWRVAASAWGRAQQLVDDQRRVASIQQVLERQIEDMVPVYPWLRQGSRAVFFQGEPRTARFLSRYSIAHRARSGLYLIEYQIRESSYGKQQLVMNETNVANPAELSNLLIDAGAGTGSGVPRFRPVEITAQTRVLLDEMADARFEYFRPSGPLGPGDWVTQWEGLRNELPRAMAIRFDAQTEPNRLQSVAVIASIENYARVRP